MKVLRLIRRDGGLSVPAVALAALAAALLTPGGSPEVQAQAPVAARVVMESRFPMPATLPLPGGASAEVVHYAVEYGPGSQTVYHSHPYGCVATVVEGQVTNRFPGSAAVAAAGKTIVTPGKQIGRHTNDSATTRAVYYATCFASASESFATPDDKAPSPPLAAKVLWVEGISMAEAPSEFMVVQRVIDYAPGAASPSTRLNGITLFTILDGQLTLTTAGGDQRLAAGSSYSSDTSAVISARNSGTGTARVLASYLVPMGVDPDTAMSAPVTGSALSTGPAAAAPGAPSVRPPSTGDAGLLE